MEPLSIQAADGQRLAARCFRPQGQARRVVLIAAAMGVPQSFYEDFARWLASQGVAAFTFDYRGMGLSAPPSLRGFHASISDWAQRDLPAVIAAAEEAFPGVPMSYIGHSLGGQIFGLVPGGERFERVLTVACGSGYRHLLARPLRRWVPLLWHVVAPVALKLAGYFPGRRLKVVGDLPRGVMLQWRRWCLDPDYVGVEGAAVRERYAQVVQPITTLIFPDDELASAEGVHKLHALYARAPVTFETIEPRAHGLRRLGHFGFFNPRAAASVWPRALSWI